VTYRPRRGAKFGADCDRRSARRWRDRECGRCRCRGDGTHDPRLVAHRAGLPSASSRSRDRRRARLDDADWLRDQHLEQSQSASAIARRLGVSTAEVSAALDHFDISHPPARRELTAEALRAAFAAGETVSSIARRVGIDRSGVRQRMRRHGIENPHAHRGRRPRCLTTRTGCGVVTSTICGR